MENIDFQIMYVYVHIHIHVCVSKRENLRTIKSYELEH